MKHLFPIDLFRKLHHRATGTKANLQIEKVFVLNLIGSEKTIGNRHPSERHERFDWTRANQASFFLVAVIHTAAAGRGLSKSHPRSRHCSGAPATAGPSPTTNSRVRVKPRSRTMLKSSSSLKTCINMSEL